MSDDKSAISQVQSYVEMGEYWDEQDLGTVWEQTETVEFELEGISSVHYFPLEKDLAIQLAGQAKERGISAQTLLNLWVQEKVLS